jgi:signal peptidase I
MSEHHDSGIVETLQSLIVAFVLAMTFRGFVAEGFVIPTGSMAPTLLGAHRLLHSDLTGYTFPVGLDQRQLAVTSPPSAVDPMIGPGSGFERVGLRATQQRPRSGDRILVLKTIYPFVEPRRWDVVVFKNPTDPKGEAGNYIKRLIGLPNETLWLADGDVFVEAAGDDQRRFVIQRKPEHIQRALWQPIHNSDHIVAARLDRPRPPSPWEGRHWDTSGRSYRTDTSEPTALHWNLATRRLDDWAMYNMLDARVNESLVPVNDLRIAAGVVAEEPGLEMIFELEARSHIFEFTVGDERARVRYRHAEEPDQWIEKESAGVHLPSPGRVLNVEFWHVDQSMRIFIDGREVVRLDYDWNAQERLEQATGECGDAAVHAAARGAIIETQLRWRFSGSPVTLHRVRVDRDIYYRTASLSPVHQRNPPHYAGPASGTHPDNLAVLGPDHYYMLGDNSQASLDSRVWGSPHSLVAYQVDESPFVVHRKLLLGKAWVVYFPAMFPLTEPGLPVVPDFGRLRYIR